jgi:hypothetical protein
MVALLMPYSNDHDTRGGIWGTSLGHEGQGVAAERGSRVCEPRQWVWRREGLAQRHGALGLGTEGMPPVIGPTRGNV